MMEAARTSETSIDSYFTRQYIPEDKSELHAHNNLLPHTKSFLRRLKSFTCFLGNFCCYGTRKLSLYGDIKPWLFCMVSVT
jgi:hypothetical protein